MTNALLDADQCPKEGILAQVFLGASASVRTLSQDVLASSGFGPHFQWHCAPPSAARRGGIDREVMTIDAHLFDGRRLLSAMKRSQSLAAEMRRFQESTRWLSHNKSNYRGLWIALDGADLLAVDASAKEVFAKVDGMVPPALVIQVEADETPFAGW